MAMFSRRTMLFRGCIGGIGIMIAPLLLATEPKITIPLYNTLSDDQEIELGRRFASLIEADLELVERPVLSVYLNGIVAALAAQSQRPSLPYTIRLVDDDDFNAFSLAGGFIYLNRGLIRATEKEDELVAVIAHEVGHVVGRHAVNQLLLNFAAKRVLEVVMQNLSKRNGTVERVIHQLGGALAMLTLLRFSRQDELQADMLGFYEMLKAGWDPTGYLGIFATLERLEARAMMPHADYLSTHPPSSARKDAIKNELHDVPRPASVRKDSRSFHAFKAALDLLPDPKRSSHEP